MEWPIKSFDDSQCARDWFAYRPSVPSMIFPAKRESEAKMGEKVVLVVEDEATIRSLVTVCLERDHFTVLSACNADEGLRTARSGSRIDFLLMQMEGGMN